MSDKEKVAAVTACLRGIETTNMTVAELKIRDIVLGSKATAEEREQAANNSSAI